ncbi:DUF1304 domain-containing protein [Streptococcus sobrinus]|uniref:DUF1304 domain-containing protein n=1 Tax=Streptococcus sobrinus TaxID=1310 RepID=UPI0003153290|nr:DUF1304 domain-containing protein [Streptococcus sobrinus]
MSIYATVLSVLVALEFFYIMYLETFATASASTSRVFGMSQEELENKNLNTLFKNQGVYNGLLGLGIFYALVYNPSLILPIMIYIVAVAAYGAATSNPKILLTQGGLAILTIAATIFLG